MLVNFVSLLEDMDKEEVKSVSKSKEEPLKSTPTRSLRLETEEDTRSITTGITANYSLKLLNESTSKDTLKLSIDVIATTSLGEAAAEWDINIKIPEARPWEITKTGLSEKEIEIGPNETLILDLKVTSPRGARYGDTVTIVLTGTSVSDPAVSGSVTTRTTAKQSMLAVKTQIGHERSVADTLAARAKDMGVHSIICPAPLRGYVIVEAMNTDRLVEIVKGIRRARGIVEGEMTFDEIEHYLTPKPLVSGIVEGDIVELIAGPFKGEKARVQHIDEPKEEITVELFEALVPIPVTVKGDSVRVIEKDR
jgi:transcriptional antiterminator NusG